MSEGKRGPSTVGVNTPRMDSLLLNSSSNSAGTLKFCPVLEIITCKKSASRLLYLSAQRTRVKPPVFKSGLSVL